MNLGCSWARLEAFASCEWASKATAWVCVRVMLWAALFLWLIGNLPFPKSCEEYPEPLVTDLRGSNVVQMLTGPTLANPTGFRSDLTPKAKDRLRVAWIGGSELQGFVSSPVGRSRPGESVYLPLQAARLLEEKTGQDVEVLLYLLYRMRTFDYYLCVLDAIGNGCDAVVISCNSVWLLNEKALSSAGGLYHTILHSGYSDMRGLLQITLFDGWRNVALSVLEKYFFAMQGQRSIQDAYSEFQLFLQRPGGKPHIEAANPLKEIVTNPPIGFWARFDGVNGSRLDSSNGQDWVQFYTRYVDPDAVLAKEYVQRCISICQEQRIPLLVYLAPLSPTALQDPFFSCAITITERFASELAEPSSDTSVIVLPTIPTRELDDLEFRDFVHAKDFGSMPDYLLPSLRTLAARAKTAK